MSYEKEVLTINEWPKGVADSATLGFGSINNCEVFETPGTLKIAPASMKMFAVSSPDSLPIAFTEDTSGNIYFLSQNGTLYRTAGGVLYSLQTGLSGAQDMIFYRDYIWISYGNSGGIVGLYGPTSGAASWFANKVTSLSSSFKKFIVCEDDVIYMSNGTNIKYMSGFTPAAPLASPTVTFSTTGWSLPGSFTNTSGTVTNMQTISTIIEYGRNIQIGTTIGKMYQWDRADTQLTDVPFQMSAGAINQLLTKENRLYIQAGTRGNVYVGDGTNFQLLQKIKWRQRRPYSSTATFLPNAICLSPNGTLLVGSSTGTDTFPSNSIHGIHEVLLQGAFPTVFKNAISTGNTGTSQSLYIGFLALSNGIVYVGWQDGSTYGFDYIGANGGGIYTSAHAESPLYQIANDESTETFTKLQLKLATPLITGQSVSVSFRKSLTDTYDAARTFSFTSMGSTRHALVINAAVTDIDQLQAKITLTSPTGVGDTNVEVLSLTLW